MKITEKELNSVRDAIAKAMNSVIRDLPHKRGGIDNGIMLTLAAQLVSFAAHVADGCGLDREEFVKIIATVVSEQWPRKEGEVFPEDLYQ